MNAMYTIGGVMTGASTIMAVNQAGQGWGLGLVVGVVVIVIAGIMEYNLPPRK